VLRPAEGSLVDLFSKPESLSQIELVGGITADVLNRLLHDPRELYRLSPERSEELIMDRLSAMHYDVFSVGKTNQPEAASTSCSVLSLPSVSRGGPNQASRETRT